MLNRLKIENFKAWREADLRFGKVTGFFGTRRCWCCRRSTKRTCHRSNTPIVRVRAHTMPSSAHRLLNTGHQEVVDADLSDYFGQIPHTELLKSLAWRVSDGRMLGWVKAWLEMAVEEDDGIRSMRLSAAFRPHSRAGRSSACSTRG